MNRITVNDRLQRNYRYVRTERPGEGFDPAFTPELTPAQMLHMGVFEGKYLNDCRAEFPAEWFDGARLSDHPDPACNAFGVKSRLSLSVWRAKGWIFEPDPRGWFQWYCRYTMGRRLPPIDALQIVRWRAFRRHKAQILKNCPPGACDCRPRQRQALLQWAYDPFF